MKNEEQEQDARVDSSAQLDEPRATASAFRGYGWRLQECQHGGAILVRGSDALPLAERHPQSHLQVLPIEDAQLMAAAPDLLAACAAHDRYLLSWGYSGPDDVALHPSAAENWRRVRAAIAKAEGRQ